MFALLIGYGATAEDEDTIEEENGGNPVVSNTQQASAAGTPTGPGGDIGDIGSSPKWKQSGKSSRPSLSKIILSLESPSAQQQALQQILNSLQIINARELIVMALTCPHTATVASKLGSSSIFIDQVSVV